jgi:hypothetical protein
MKAVDYTFIHNDEKLEITSRVSVPEDASSDAIARTVVCELNKQLKHRRIYRTGVAGSTNRPAPGKRTEHYWAVLSDDSQGYIHITEE